jgi:hypothetical protein
MHLRQHTSYIVSACCVCACVLCLVLEEDVRYLLQCVGKTTVSPSNSVAAAIQNSPWYKQRCANYESAIPTIIECGDEVDNTYTKLDDLAQAKSYGNADLGFIAASLAFVQKVDGELPGQVVEVCSVKLNLVIEKVWAWLQAAPNSDLHPLSDDDEAARFDTLARFQEVLAESLITWSDNATLANMHLEVGSLLGQASSKKKVGLLQEAGDALAGFDLKDESRHGALEKFNLAVAAAHGACLGGEKPMMLIRVAVGHLVEGIFKHGVVAARGAAAMEVLAKTFALCQLNGSNEYRSLSDRIAQCFAVDSGESNLRALYEADSEDFFKAQSQVEFQGVRAVEANALRLDTFMLQGDVAKLAVSFLKAEQVSKDNALALVRAIWIERCSGATEKLRVSVEQLQTAIHYGVDGAAWTQFLSTAKALPDIYKEASKLIVARPDELLKAVQAVDEDSGRVCARPVIGAPTIGASQS